MNAETRALHAALRQDFVSFIRKTFGTVVPGRDFVHNWHIDAIAYELTRCYLGETRRLIITVPPRYLKSIAASVAFPAWILGHDPTAQIICASYTSELAVKHALDTRAVMTSEWYRECFKQTRLDPKRNTQTELTTTRRGTRLATSVGGTLTGRGGQFVIIDDPHKADEALSETKREVVKDWFRNSVLSRLDSKQEGCIILIQQRLHEDDLAGLLLAERGWRHLNLPAIAEAEEHIPLGDNRIHVRQPGEPLDSEREPLAVLDEMKQAMGSHIFAAQYQQRPTPLGGGLLKREWFKRYAILPKTTEYTPVLQSWDTAMKGEETNDPSVCLTFVEIDHCYYLVDVYRKRVEYPDLKRAVVDQAKKFKATRILIEDAGSGTVLLQDLRKETRLSLLACKPEGDKIIRASTASAQIEAGRLYLPEEAPWLADFEHEVVTFPQGRHDDQVDALSQFINWSRHRITSEDQQTWVCRSTILDGLLDP